MLSPQEISDRLEIQDLVFHYADLIDRKQLQRLRGINGKNLRNLVAQMVERLIEMKIEECLVKSPDELMHYLDRQLRGVGLRVIGILTWPKKYTRKDPARI